MTKYKIISYLSEPPKCVEERKGFDTLFSNEEVKRLRFGNKREVINLPTMWSDNIQYEFSIHGKNCVEIYRGDKLIRLITKGLLAHFVPKLHYCNMMRKIR